MRSQVFVVLFFICAVRGVEISVDGTNTTIDQALGYSDTEIDIILLPGSHTIQQNHEFNTDKIITIRTNKEDMNAVYLTTTGTIALSYCSSLGFQNIHFLLASLRFNGIPDISMQNAYVNKVQEFVTFAFYDSTATIVDSVFSQLSLAIYARGSSLTMRNTVMEGGYFGSILKELGGELHIDNCTFTYNSGAGDNAAAINATLNSNVTITRSFFLHNYWGAAVALRNSASILIEDTLFLNNSNSGAAEPGGALYIDNAQSVEIQRSQFISNSGFGSLTSAVVIVDVTFSLQIDSCAFRSNKVGPAVYLERCGDVVIEKSNFEDNLNDPDSANSKGGAIQFVSSPATIENSNFTRNSAKFGGAVGVFNTSSFIVRSSLFINNTSTRGAKADNSGGAVFVSVCNFLTVSETVFTSNSAFYGGALSLISVFGVDITATDFTKNDAFFYGAGVYLFESSGDIVNASFVSNAAKANGSAIFSDKSNVTVKGYFDKNDNANEQIQANSCTSTFPYASIEVLKSWTENEETSCLPCQCVKVIGENATIRATLAEVSTIQVFRDVTGVLAKISADRIFISEVNATSTVIVDFYIREAGPSHKGELSASDARQAILSLSVNQYMGSKVTVLSIRSLPLSDETITDSPINNDSGSNNGSGSANKGAIIGGVIGGIAFIAIIVVVVFILMRRRKTKHNNNENESELHVVNESSSSSSSLIPKDAMITNVTLENVIGRGNFGEVYQGTWNNATKVALKKLKEGYEQQFAQESSLLMKLNHPNVVRILGVYKHSDNALYMVLEFCKLGSLDSFLQYSTDLTIQQRLSMARDIAAGMQYLETKKVIHRDLSARNILAVEVDGRLSVKISDLGLSRESEDYYRSDNKQIPYKWCAPEVIKYAKSTSKSDVWSYAVCLWEIFSNGEVPYQGMTNTEVINQVAEGYRLSKPSLCPDVVYELMMECWNKDPNARPTFAEIHQTINSTLERVADMPTSVVLKQPSSNFYQ